MGNQQPSGQRSVSGNDISELASGLSQLAMALQSQNQAQPKAKAMPKAKVAAQAPGPVSATMPLLQASCLLEGGHLCQ